MNQTPESDNSLVISFLTLRKAIGVIGISLPIVVSIGAYLIFKTGLRITLSAYYYTGMVDVFVGSLCAIGVFLLSYKGFERKDAIAGNLGCVFAVGVALFPTAPAGVSCGATHIWYCLHPIFAALLFLTLTYFSLCLFTKTDQSKPLTRQKILRNRIYKICGYTMLACIILIPARYLLPNNINTALAKIKPVFWLEAIAIVAFGVSWLTKGEAILSDED